MIHSSMVLCIQQTSQRMERVSHIGAKNIQRAISTEIGNVNTQIEEEERPP